MSDRIWRFQGKLQENEKRVLTSVEGSISKIDAKKPPVLDIKNEDGKTFIDLKIPVYQPPEIIENPIGKQFYIDGKSENILGQKYGEIFNDYDYNVASGIYSHVTGYGNEAQHPYQAVFGKYNKNNKDNIFEIGYGNDENNRKNIFYVTKTGDIKITGDITNGDNLSLTSLNKNKLELSQFDYYIGESQASIHRDTNGEEIIFSNETETTISLINFLTTDATTPLYWGIVPFILSEDAIVTFKYYINEILQSEDTLQQKCFSGKNFLTLFNALEINENYAGALKITMSISKGQVTIPSFGIKSSLYVQGVGITAAWNGKINVEQGFKAFRYDGEILVSNFSSEVTIQTQKPVLNALSDTFGKTVIGGMQLTGFSSDININ